ncbi:Ca2+ regulator and membrane fusion protein Fig1-domain-containing protein [Annulohypoxylon truncatum]|uniref:Ca2+ regulator and membrane fusion protein Fig1-domain-containing protein n=1 Tax=Annulohypoxylon truncatum TaxID=327061 RepID=UPI002007780E|nr:Ca2+ regulator and membrane fusion protein Fig1-domain-containing protein [Annulohypoxylon truncatum]KAI1213730.1 Ca2+ regulator and membrane fusion protein Fig1-domain-containing protein [Annulohypoxylon truncatum]
MIGHISQAFKNVDLRFVAYTLMAILLAFYVVPELFLLKLQAKGLEGVEVRVGYYGMCVTKGKNDGLTCFATFARTPDTLDGMFLSDSGEVAQGNTAKVLLLQANVIQNKIFCPLLAVSGGLFLLSVIYMLFLKRYIKGDNQNASKKKERFKSGMQFFRQYAFGFAVAAAFSTTQATGALKYATTTMATSESSIIFTGGKAVQGMQWTILALLCLVHLAVSAMFDGDGCATKGDNRRGGI